jgi:site-specific recombinase XerD
MTLMKNLGSKSRPKGKGITLYGQELLEELNAQGYASSTVRFNERTIRRFCQEIEQRNVDDLDEHTIDAICKALINKASKSVRTYTTFCLRRFVDHLIKAGVVALAEKLEKERTAFERLQDEYDAYLRVQRGLGDSTVTNCMLYFKRFMLFRFGETVGNLNSITTDDITTFICDQKAGLRPYLHKSLPSHLRTFFNFLFWSGKTKRDLTKGIPRVAQNRHNNLPRHLKPEDVQRLLDAVRTTDEIGRRNYAMLLLLARLGLRAPEVIAIQLDDINWRSGEILIRGKGKRHDRMPLPADVGEAIVDYIKNGRAGTSRTLFVSSITPHRPFKDAQILNSVLRKAFERTGLKPPQKYVGSHLLRHSLAIDLLRNGGSLKEIGDVLRHRSRKSTMIYAKHDINALRSIVRTWPVKGDAL